MSKVDRKTVDFGEDDIVVVFPKRWNHMNKSKWKIVWLETHEGETKVVLHSNEMFLTDGEYLPSAHYISIEKVPEWGEQLREFVSRMKPVPYSIAELLESIAQGDVAESAECAVALATEQRIRQDVENLGKESEHDAR